VLPRKKHHTLGYSILARCLICSNGNGDSCSIVTIAMSFQTQTIITKYESLGRVWAWMGWNVCLYEQEYDRGHQNHIILPTHTHRISRQTKFSWLTLLWFRKLTIRGKQNSLRRNRKLKNFGCVATKHSL
jgi:hypothetical protein